MTESEFIIQYQFTNVIKRVEVRYNVDSKNLNTYVGTYFSKLLWLTCSTLEIKLLRYHSMSYMTSTEEMS